MCGPIISISAELLYMAPENLANISWASLSFGSVQFPNSFMR